MRNQAPDYALNVSNTDRVALTCYQSMKVYKNPYGDYANEFIKALNATWFARKTIQEMLLLQPELSVPFNENIEKLNQMIREGIAFLERHKEARPYKFSQFTGYYYVDLSETKWEGHWSNR